MDPFSMTTSPEYDEYAEPAVYQPSYSAAAELTSRVRRSLASGRWGLRPGKRSFLPSPTLQEEQGPVPDSVGVRLKRSEGSDQKMYLLLLR